MEKNDIALKDIRGVLKREGNIEAKSLDLPPRVQKLFVRGLDAGTTALRMTRENRTERE